MAKKKPKKKAPARKATPKPKGRSITTTTSSKVVKTVRANPTIVRCAPCIMQDHASCMRGTATFGGNCTCECARRSNPGLIPAGISFATLSGNPPRRRDKPGVYPLLPFSQRRVDVLCGCGWGRLSVAEEDVPNECPMCGYGFTASSFEEPGNVSCPRCRGETGSVQWTQLCEKHLRAVTRRRNPMRKDECAAGGCSARVVQNESFCPTHLAEFEAWEQNPLTAAEGRGALRGTRASIRGAQQAPTSTAQAFMAGTAFGQAGMIGRFGTPSHSSQASGLEAAAWQQYERARHQWPPVTNNPPCTCGAQDGYKSPFSGRWECRSCKAGGPGGSAATPAVIGRYHAAAEAAFDRLQGGDRSAYIEFNGWATLWVYALYGGKVAGEAAIQATINSSGAVLDDAGMRHDALVEMMFG